MAESSGQAKYENRREQFWLWLATVAVRRANRAGGPCRYDGLSRYRLAVPIDPERFVA